jgi:hypothetical protein
VYISVFYLGVGGGGGSDRKNTGFSMRAQPKSVIHCMSPVCISISTVLIHSVFRIKPMGLTDII